MKTVCAFGLMGMMCLICCSAAFAADAPMQQQIHLEGTLSCTAADSTYGSAETIVNGSGINEDGFHPFEHWDGENGGSGMWVTNAGGGGSAANHPAGLECSTWLKITFDRTYPLGVMWVWNHNQWRPSLDETNRGLKNVQIHYTADGQTWTKLGDYVFPRMVGAEWVAHNYEVDFGGVPANAVLITASKTDGNYGSSYYGMSELMFGIHGTAYDPYSKHPAEASIDAGKIAATASSSWPGLDPAYTINGKPLEMNYRQTSGWWHASGTTELSAAEPNETPVGAAWLRYDFDKPYTLGEMWLWNHNQPGLTGRGLRKVFIDYYDGMNWNRLMNDTGDHFILTQASGNALIEHTDAIDFDGITATSVVITADPNGGMWGDPASGPYYGMTEVLFGIANTVWTAPGEPEIVLPAEDAIHDTRITAVASSEYESNNGAQNTVNGSGLNWKTLLHDNHGNAWTMWHADGNTNLSSAHPNTMIGYEWIRFNFDKSYPLGMMWVWNQNQSNLTSRGLKKVYIEYTADGQNWSRLMDGTNDYFIFDQASGENHIQYTTAVNFAGVDANSVVITADATEGHWGGAPYVGLSEVRFGIYGTAYRGHPVPVEGDIDDDFDVDDEDVRELYGDWLDDNTVSAQRNTILDDFESYFPVADPNLSTQWTLQENADVNQAITLLTNPAEAHSGSQAMRWTWQEITDGAFAYIVCDANNIDLNDYDQFSLWMYRHDSKHQQFVIEPLDEQKQPLAAYGFSLFPDSVEQPVGQWARIVVNLNEINTSVPIKYIQFRTTTDYTTDPGTIDIDDIAFYKRPECGMLRSTDINSDCVVNLDDFVIIATHWLEGTVY